MGKTFCIFLLTVYLVDTLCSRQKGGGGMTIKELETRSGLPRTAIRFYEQEGFIAPERKANNYRNYSEEDARTLEKVKLLRQLSLDLETIRALKEGSLSLAQAMEHQACVLEGDQKDLERYARVCRELSEAQADYDSLEPEPWLEELSQTQLPPTRKVDPAQEDGLRGPHPWRRYWARCLDLLLMSVAAQILQYQVLGWYVPPVWLRDELQDAANLALELLLLFVMEPLLLCTWGYTPSKWLLGLQVRRLDGRKLAWDQGVERLFSVLWFGNGMCIPLYREWRNWTCYEICTDGRPLPWEKENRCMALPIRRSRWVIWVVCWAAVVALANGSDIYSYVPPYPDAPLTPAQVVENYNFYELRFSDVDNHASVLNPDGSWKTLPAVYQNQDWAALKDENFGEWSPVTFATHPDGTVSAIEVDFSPKGDPYEDQMNVGWVMNEVLSPLILAADSSGEARNPLRVNERNRQAYGICDRLLDVPFQGAGAESQAEGPGGMIMTLAVTECSGYEPEPDVGDYSVLIQEEPGAGTLSFHITLTMPQT